MYATASTIIIATTTKTDNSSSSNYNNKNKGTNKYFLNIAVLISQSEQSRRLRRFSHFFISAFTQFCDFRLWQSKQSYQTITTAATSTTKMIDKKFQHLLLFFLPFSSSTLNDGAHASPCFCRIFMGCMMGSQKRCSEQYLCCRLIE